MNCFPFRRSELCIGSLQQCWVNFRAVPIDLLPSFFDIQVLLLVKLTNNLFKVFFILKSGFLFGLKVGILSLSIFEHGIYFWINSFFQFFIIFSQVLQTVFELVDIDLREIILSSSLSKEIAFALNPFIFLFKFFHVLFAILNRAHKLFHCFFSLLHLCFNLFCLFGSCWYLIVQFVSFWILLNTFSFHLL